jgi:hypothetical protein
MSQEEHFKNFFIPALLFISLIITSCHSKPTPYQPKGFSGGFKEKKVSENTYEVTFAGNIYIKAEKERFYTLVRCAELAVQNGKRYFVILQEQPRSHRFKIVMQLADSPGLGKQDAQNVLELAQNKGVKLESATIRLMSNFNRQRSSPSDHKRNFEGSQSRDFQEPELSEPVSLEVVKVSLAPTKIKAGSTFDLIVQFTAKDITKKQEKIPVQFGFSILKDSKVIFKKEPFTLDSLNGKSTKRTQNVNASKKQGDYIIEVELRYKNKIETMRKDLKIE